MKHSFSPPRWLRVLALTSCLGLAHVAIAAPSNSSSGASPTQKMYDSEIDQPAPGPNPGGDGSSGDDTLLAPESAVHAMELYESTQGDTATGSILVENYLNSLSDPERMAYVNYFEEQAQKSLEAAEERYELEALVDPKGALIRYQDSLSQTQGYDGTEPHSVPVSAAMASSSSEREKVASPTENPKERPLVIDDPVEGGDDGGGGGGGSYPTQQPPAAGCSSYTDRFGNPWSRCDNSPIAYVYIHGAGSYNNFGEASWSYWGSNNLAGSSLGVDRFFVSWDARQSVQSQANTVRTALDTLCAPLRPCVLITHSAGGLMMGYILSQENRWNILRVHATQSAAGGSELANATLIAPSLWLFNSMGLLSGLGGYPIYSLSLPVPLARGMYNHDVTRGVPFITYSSEKERTFRSCKWYQFGCQLDNVWSSLVNNTLRSLYNGGSDWLIAYHSSNSFRSPNLRPANTACNPDSPASLNGFGLPYYSATDRQAAYWTNYSSYHWQPQNQSFMCRKGFPQLGHSGGEITGAMPRPW